MRIKLDDDAAAAAAAADTFAPITEKWRGRRREVLETGSSSWHVGASVDSAHP